MAGATVVHTNVPDSLPWEAVPTELDRLYHGYKGQFLLEVARNPFAPQWQIQTPLGQIKVANSHWSPFSFVYDLLSAPTRPLGGPTPLLLSLVGGAYGAGLGALGGLLYGTIANAIGSDMVNTPQAVKRLAILGGILGSLPFIAVGLSRTLHGQGLKGFINPWPEGDIAFTKAGQWRPIPVYVVNEPHWRETVLEDPFLAASEKTLASAPVYAASLAAGRNDVTPGEIGYTTLKAGLGSLFGYMLGNVAGSILSLSPKMREKLRETGMLAGMIKSIL